MPLKHPARPPMSALKNVKVSSNLMMVEHASWFYNDAYNHHRNENGVFHPKVALLGNAGVGTGVFHPKLELLKSREKVGQESIDDAPIDILVDDLQAKILSFLPFPCVVRASCVCKKWNQIILSGTFKPSCQSVLCKQPWYFIFSNSSEPFGFVYNPILDYWCKFHIPLLRKRAWKIGASCGLVCFMDDDQCNFEMCVCNLITGKCKKIEEPVDAQDFVYSSLAFAVDQSSHRYTTAIVRSRQFFDNCYQFHVIIHIYDSKNMSWLPPFFEILDGWRSGTESVICGVNLYFLVTRIGETNRRALLTYNLEKQYNESNLIESLIPMPCFLTCARLMNLRNKLVMVGGIGRREVPEGIGVWTLKGNGWEEVSRVPEKFFRQGQMDVDDVFACGGGGDLIYIHTYETTNLLLFNMKLKQWRWCEKCPLHNKSYLQLFSGFCFEARLDISI